MRKLSLILLPVLFLLSTFSPFSSLRAEGRLQSAERDSSAILTLKRALQRTNWGAARSRGGIVASGTLERLADDGSVLSSPPLTIRSRIGGMLRLDLTEPYGEVTTVVSGQKGAIANGTKIKRLRPHSAVAMNVPYFAFFSDFGAPNDSDLSILGGTQAVIQSEAATAVVIRRLFNDSDPLARVKEIASTKTIWISNATSLPLRIDVIRLSPENWNATIDYSLAYSDWRNVDGVLVPFQIQEAVEGRSFSRIRLNTVQFNSQIPDSTFEIGGTN